MELRGVRVHNLKNLDLDIPLHQLVVLTGVSGSGKSSLAFETLFAEGQRRYIESFSIAARRHLERIERPNADRVAHVPVAIAVRSDRSRGNRPDIRTTVASVAELLDGFRLLFARAGRIICPGCTREIRAQSAADVVKKIISLPVGTRCQLGFATNDVQESDCVTTWLARGFSRAIWDGVTHNLSEKPTWPAGEKWIVVDRLVSGKAVSERILESAETALREGEGRCCLWIDSNEATESETDDTCAIDRRTWQIARFSRRLECLACQRLFLPPEPRLFSHLMLGACRVCRGTGQSSSTEHDQRPCQACEGTRLREEARAVHVGDLSIANVYQLNPSAALAFVRQLPQTLPSVQEKFTELIRVDIEQRLSVVCSLGLDYLRLNRPANSLSGGELRRLTLAAVIGSRITGTLVVVDEPSAGLTEAELPQVLAALRQVQSRRNSVVVVDHSSFIVSAADHVIELGPQAGPNGGNIIYQGHPAGRIPEENRPALLESGKPDAAIPPITNRQSMTTSTSTRVKDSLRLTKVRHHNLYDFQVEFPLGQLCVVTGPSGSGKTSLVTQVLFPTMCQQLGLPCDFEPIGSGELSGTAHLVDVVLVDQSPLTKSSRSNPATWLDVFDDIRQTFAMTMDAKQRGFTSRQFSFNSSAGGRCRSCLGTGLLKHDMQFLPDVTLPCPECGGTRYRQEILDVKYRGRSIAEVLAMSVLEAIAFFRSQPRIQHRLQILKQIGLDYLVLGQPSETLSGGEAQRLKLASRLTTPPRGACLIICDEPTTGLHPTDVHRLVACFRELLANGHSLVLADNSPELIDAADVVVELGRPDVPKQPKK